MRLVAAIEDPRGIPPQTISRGPVAAKILTHLNLPARVRPESLPSVGPRRVPASPPRGRPWRDQRELALELEHRADDYDAIDPPAFAD